MTDNSIMPDYSLNAGRKILSGIYKITSPSGKIYIGQSVDIALRYHKYNRRNCAGQPKLFASIKKYGFESHVFEILQLCGIDELNQLEKQYIDLYKTFESECGLNLREGGGAGRRLSEHSKMQIILKLKGKKGNRKGSKHSIESRKKISLSNRYKIPWNKGIKNCFSEDTRDKMSMSLKNNNNAIKTPVYQYLPNYELIQKYMSITEASRKTGISRTGIINNIKKRTKTSGGFIWDNSVIIV